MSPRQLTQTRILNLQWHWRRGISELVVGMERRASYLYDDGLLVQRTEAATEPARPPACFVRQQAGWRRFLEQHPIEEFLLKYVQEWERRLGPPPLWLAHRPEWTLHLDFTTSALGQQILTHSERCRLPPSGTWMQRLAALKRLTGRPANLSDESVLLIPGDLLLHWLSPALDHAIQVIEAVGHWHGAEATRRQGPETTRTFLPKTRYPRPKTYHKALFLETQQNLLYCESAGGSILCFELKGPFYRLLSDLRFGLQTAAANIKGTAYRMPEAYLNLAQTPVGPGD